MKKCIAWTLLLALFCSLFSGCSRKQNGDEYVPTGDALLMEGEEPVDLAYEDEELQTLDLCYYPEFSMNPLIGVNITNRVLFSLMYQPLFAIDRKNNPWPILCAYYQSSSDNRTWTIYVDTNARFSDGSPVKVDDVVASYEAAKESDYYRGRFTHIEEFEAGENNTIIFHLDTAYENLALLLDIPIVKAGTTGDDHPIGSGPYYFTENANNASLVKVQNWWSNAKIATQADTIPLIEAKSQAMVRDEFEFASLDLAISNPMSDSYAEYRCDYELWEVETGIFTYIGCNVLWSEWFKNGRNEALRKALTYAINREELINDFYRGRAHATTLPSSPASPYYSESLAARYTYDPLKFVDAINGAYIPTDDKGRDKKLLLLVNCDDSARLRAGRAIAQQLTELGLTTGTLEYGGSTGTTYEQVLQAGSFDIYLGQTKLPPNNDLSEFFRGWGNLWWGGITNGTLLNMCKESLANSGNYYNLNKMVVDDASIIPIMFGYYEVYAERGHLLNLEPSRDNVFFYTTDKTMESARLTTEYN